MGCFKPLDAWRSRFTKSNGKSYIRFKLPPTGDYEYIKVKCGRCLGCRLDKSRDWAIRCYHEALSHKDNCFVTLTYDDEHLPPDKAVNKRHFQLFMKKLRKHYPNDKIRYLHCGEYGDKNGRPHYHVLFFGFNFPLRIKIPTRSKFPAYISPDLKKLWEHGFHYISDLTFESAAYTCRYATKKLSEGRTEEDWERYLDKYGYELEDGSRGLKQPEYITMSRRPGIGRDHIEKYTSDIIDGRVRIQGKEYCIPKYYDSYLEANCKEDFERIKEGRIKFIESNPELFTEENLKRKEEATKRRYRNYKLSRPNL